MRKILDDAGFHEAKIVASDSLDGSDFITQKPGAQIDVWGVGTNLVTARDQPALGGVYKLSAVREPGGAWAKIKLSNTPIKVSNPGIQQIGRYYNENGQPITDMIYDEVKGPNQSQYSLIGQRSHRSINHPQTPFEDLLIRGHFRPLRQKSPDIHQIRPMPNRNFHGSKQGFVLFKTQASIPLDLKHGFTMKK